MDFGIHGKVGLVLGAGGGLGGAIARQLAAEGVRVAAADLNAEAAAATVAEIVAEGATGMAVSWDLADLSLLDSAVAEVEAAFGAVDILINNTGGPPPTPAGGQKAALWQSYFQSMVLCVMGVTDRVLPTMRERRWGRIVTSTSSGVIAPIPNLGISNALRLSLVGWSKTLAREVARDGVTANIVVPGRIATARTRSLDVQRATREGREVETVSAESAATIPMGRYGDPREYADAVAFLASARASYITGAILRVDGGFIPSI
jgi:3-oxoacyl-[acyl-carrier protein] reductase